MLVSLRGSFDHIPAQLMKGIFYVKNNKSKTDRF